MIISPELTGVGIVDLDSKSLLMAIKAGEEEAIKQLPKIRKKIQQKSQMLRVEKT